MKIKLAITGHRTLTKGQATWVRKQLRILLERAQQKFGDDLVALSGMALGVDTWWAKTALQMKIPLHAYIPSYAQTGQQYLDGKWLSFGSGREWNDKDRKMWLRILDHSELVVNCKDTFRGSDGAWESLGALLHHRNRVMINDCTYLGGAWNGMKGGTSHCLSYALGRQRRIYFIDIQKKIAKWDTLPVNSEGKLVLKAS